MASQLSELQVAELKKAFSICDLDGSGTIVASELRVVIRAITNEDPNDQEFQQIVATVDQNGDGNITWKEFLEAMTEWLAEDFNASQSARRKLSAVEERAELHLKIKGFFSQFSPSQNFDVIRQKLQRYGSASSSLLGSGSNQHMNTDGLMSNQEKLDFLLQYRNGMEGIPDALTALFSSSRFDHHRGASHFAKLLHIVEVFNTPQERRTVVDDIVPLFEKLIQNNVPKRLVQMCQFSDQPPLQLQALRAISLFAPGPRVASTPRDSLLHPSQMYFKKVLFKENAVTVVFQLCASPVLEVMNQAVICVGAFAAHNPETRDFLLQNGVLEPLLKLVRTDAPVDLLINVSWSLAVLCGVTHPSHSLPNSSVIQPALKALGTMLFANNEKIIRNVLVALAITLPGMSPELPVSRRLVELLGANMPTVVVMGLHTITDLVRFDNQHTQSLLKCNLLQSLKKLITDKSVEIRIAACDLIDVLASVRGHVQSLIDSDLIAVILKLIPMDEEVRWKLVKVVKYVTRGTPSQVAYLCDRGVVQILCKRFGEFKTYDRVLSEVYKYVGATFNFELIGDVLTSLLNILNVGEMLREDMGSGNPYALQFDMGAMDHLHSFLQTIKSSKESDLNAWRRHSDNEASVETKITSLVTKLKKAVKEEGSGSNAHIVAMVDRIEAEFLSQAATPAKSEAKKGTTSSESVLLKCYLKDDISVVDVPPNLTYVQLTEGVANKYGRALKISYKDLEGDLIKIDSDAVLRASFKAHGLSKEPTMKIYLTEFPAEPTPTPTPSTSTPASSQPMSIPGSSARSTTPQPSTSPFGSPVSVRRTRERDYFSNTPPRTLNASAGSLHRSTDASSSQSGGDRFAQLKRSREGPDDELAKQPSKRFNPLVQPPLSSSTGFSLTLDVEQIRHRQVHDLLRDLEKSTYFGIAELTTLHEWVRKNSGASGTVNRETFAKGLAEIGITDPLTVEQNFSAFDSNKNGQVDFREFVAGLSVLMKGTEEDRLGLMFRAFDLDGDNFLSPEEILHIFRVSVLAHGSKVDDVELTKVVNSLLNDIDENSDGKISFDEFKKAIRSQKLPFAMNPLQNSGTPQQSLNPTQSK
eukprot:TRINITY_DN7206_c0_g1_i1.p1 TRINITY_DN7206_c0_g1~~TRINITY_DN7206_c0_g1_i1.p1  ORF type:complete len:1094 (+),score=255.51 TRINITY_DN7206_c0_g1_i1:127-3408(+)